VILFTPAAERDLKKLDPPVRERIREALRAIEADSGNATNVKRLQGGGRLYRLRAGDYRVVFEIIRGDVLVQLVAHRRDVYRRARRRGDL